MKRRCQEPHPLARFNCSSTETSSSSRVASIKSGELLKAGRASSHASATQNGMAYSSYIPISSSYLAKEHSSRFCSESLRLSRDFPCENDGLQSLGRRFDCTSA